jgi:hypothetical protein
MNEKGDVDRAGENLDVLRQRRAELEQEIEAEVASLSASLDAAAVDLETVSVAPRKSDVAVGRLLLCWEPWRIGADGFEAPAWQA